LATELKRLNLGRIVFLMIGLFALFPQAYGLVFDLPPTGSDLIGKMQFAKVYPGDNFATIARRYDIGFYELVEANPEIDADHPDLNQEVVVPSWFILPRPRKGLVINLAEMRLYYYPPNSRKVYTFPVGIGREGWMTPVGQWKVTEKNKDPQWIAPKAIRDARAKDGVFIPKVVLPGAMNPLGEYSIRLSLPAYLLHGTNEPSGVGRRSSSGCIRLFPEDIETLFKDIPLNTPVTIINEPYKVGHEGGQLFLEVHVPLQEQNLNNRTLIASTAAEILSQDKTNDYLIHWEAAKKLSEVQVGIPMLVGEKA